MGSYMNFKNFGEAPFEGGGERPNNNPPLARQSSVYSLTLDEFQNSLNGFGKDFGSMNMDELLKNIWTAEETQAMAMATSSVAREGNNGPSGSLPRQGSLTLPRTLSLKTVDEVWKDLFQGSTSASANDGMSNAGRGSLVQERQPTLGDITLEEFLSRAGVVREDTNPMGRPNNNGFISDLSRPNNGNDSNGRPNNNGFISDLSQPNNRNDSVGRPNNNGFFSDLSRPNNGNDSIGRPNNNGFISDQSQPNNRNDLIGRPNNNGFISDLSQPNNRNASVGRPNNNGFFSDLSQPNARNDSIGRPNNNGGFSDLPQPNNSHNSVGRPNNNGFFSDQSQPNTRNDSVGRPNNIGVFSDISQPNNTHKSVGRPINNGFTSDLSQPNNTHNSVGRPINNGFISDLSQPNNTHNSVGRPMNNGFISDLSQPNNAHNSVGRPMNNGFISDLSQPNNSNHGIAVGSQQAAQHSLIMANRFPENSNSSHNRSSMLQQNISTPRPHQNLLQQQPLQQQQLQTQRLFPQQQATLAFASPVPSASNGLVQGSVAQRESLFEPIKVVPNAGTFLNQLPPDNVRKSTVEQLFPKQVTVAFASSTTPASYEMKSHGATHVNGTFGQGNFTEKRLLGLTGLVNEKPLVKAGSPVNHLASDRVANSYRDASVSPLPYMYNVGGRGRRGGAAMERATERRHKRMIKNRESAARSRARKQAYTLELEAEIDKLKVVNEQLRKQQEEIIEMQKNKVTETVSRPWGSKKLNLRRTLTGPW